MSDSRRMDTGRSSRGQRFKEVMLGERPRDRRNAVLVLIWAAIWAVTYTATLRTLRAGPAEGVFAWGLIAATAFTGFMALRAFARNLREADEMQRWLHVDAVAFGFGAGVVFFFASEIAAAMGGPVSGNKPVIGVMFLAFAGKLLWNLWRKR